MPECARHGSSPACSTSTAARARCPARAGTPAVRTRRAARAACARAACTRAACIRAACTRAACTRAACAPRYTCSSVPAAGDRGNPANRTSIWPRRAPNAA